MFQVASDAQAPPPIIEMELKEMVVGAQQGDPKAFTRLYEIYYSKISTYLAHMVGNAEEGRDLAQETFIKTWMSLPEMPENLNFKSWFYRVATNTALDYLRKRQLHSIITGLFHPEDREEVSDPSAGFEERIAEREQIQQALASIKNPRYRACMLLQTQIGFSQRTIATMLKMSETSVSTYVKRGLEEFAEAYKNLENGETNTTRKKSPPRERRKDQ